MMYNITDSVCVGNIICTSECKQLAGSVCDKEYLDNQTKKKGKG